jgi:hypothetical protein
MAEIGDTFARLLAEAQAASQSQAPVALGPPDIPPGTPAMSTYQPTWRERIGGWLMGDGGGVAKRNFVSGLVGSTGLPNTGRQDTAGFSLADFIPVAGPAMNANDALREGDDKAAFASSLMAAAPIAAPLARAAIKAAPAVAGTVGGVLGAALSPSDAAGPGAEPTADLPPQPQRAPYYTMQPPPAEIAGYPARVKRWNAEQEALKRRMDADVDARYQTEMQNWQTTANAARESAMVRANKQKSYEANRPMREQYPMAFDALTYGPALVAGTAGWRAGRMAQKRLAQQEDDISALVARAEEAQAAGKKVPVSVTRALKAAEDTPLAPAPPVGTIATGTVGAALAPLIPYGFDYQRLPAGSEGRQAAENILDPTQGELYRRLGLGAAEGLVAGTVGSELPTGIRRQPSPMVRAMGFRR